MDIDLETNIDINALPLDNAEDYRAFCLALADDVTEKMPFGKFAERFAGILALYVNGHMFTYADTDSFAIINVKVPPETVDELYARYTAVTPPMNISKRHWVGINVHADMPPHVLRALLRQAYGIVKDKYRKKQSHQPNT